MIVEIIWTIVNLFLFMMNEKKSPILKNIIFSIQKYQIL